MTSYFRLPGRPDRPRLRPAHAVRARGRPARGARACGRTPRCPAPSTSPATACCALPGGPPARQAALPLPRPAGRPSARLVQPRRLVDFSPEQQSLPHLRPRRRHHPDAEARWASSPRTPPRRRFDDFARRSARRPRAASLPERSKVVERARRSSVVALARQLSRAGRMPRRHVGAGRPSDAATIRASCERGRGPPTSTRRRARPGRRRVGRSPAPKPTRPRATDSAARPWRSCAAGSPATTRSTSSASTPSSPSSVLLAALRPLYEKWFRVEVRGIENIPTEGGALVVANHSGHPAARRPDDRSSPCSTSTPRTGTCACSAPTWSSTAGGQRAGPQGRRHAGLQRGRRADARARRAGRASGPRASRASASRSPSATSCSASAAAASSSAALRTGVPIIPCSIVGAEEIYPMIGNVTSLARLLGLPYFPITPLFPLARPARRWSRCPAKWIIEFGEPIRTDAYDDGRRRRPDAGLQPDRPGARDDPADALHAAHAAPRRLLLTARP